MTSIADPNRRWDREAVGIATGALVVYAAHVSAYPPLHEWGVRLAGLIEPSVYRGWGDPLWSLFVETLVWCGVRPLTFWASMVSAACAAASVALCFSAARAIPMVREPGAWRNEGDERNARRLAGWVAAAVLFAAPSVWMAATQPGPAAIDLLILTALLRAWIAAWRSHRARNRRVFVLLWAAAIWEYPPLAAAAPVIGLGLLLHTARARLPLRSVAWDGALALAGWGVAGVAVVLCAAARPDLAWFEIETPRALAAALKLMLRKEFLSAWPATGWLLIGAVYLAPLLLLVREGTLPANRTERVVVQGFALLASGIMLNAVAGGPASPWALTLDRPLLLSPYVALALWGAHGVAFAAYAREQRDRRRFPIGWVALPAALVFCTLAHRTESAPAASLRRMGRALESLVRSAAPQPIWLTGGKLDPALRVLARDNRLTPLILNTALAEHPAYLRQLDAAAPPEKARVLEDLGLSGLLYAESRRPGVVAQWAVFEVPPFWADMLQLDSVPGAGWFRWRQRPASDPTPDAEAWRAFAMSVSPAREWTPPGGPFRPAALALAAYLKSLAAAQQDEARMAQWEPPPARNIPWRHASERTARRWNDESARARRAWAAAEEHLRIGRKDEARAAFERVRSLYPPLALRALERLLLLDYLEEQWEETDRHVRALSSLAPGHPLLFWMRGQTLARRGQKAEAARAFQLSLASGESPLAHHALAVLLSDARAWDRALPHAERAVALAPGHPAFLATRGTIHSFLGRRADAIADFEQALRAGGRTVPSISLNLAALYISDGLAAQARELLASVEAGPLSEADRAHAEVVRARLPPDER